MQLSFQLPPLEKLRISHVKRAAKEVKRGYGIPHLKALDVVSAWYGFSSYQEIERKIGGDDPKHLVAKAVLHKSKRHNEFKRHKIRNKAHDEINRWSVPLGTATGLIIEKRSLIPVNELAARVLLNKSNKRL